MKRLLVISAAIAALVWGTVAAAGFMDGGMVNPHYRGAGGAPPAGGEHFLLIDGAGHYLLIDGASHKLRIDGAS